MDSKVREHATFGAAGTEDDEGDVHVLTGWPMFGSELEENTVLFPQVSSEIEDKDEEEDDSGTNGVDEGEREETCTEDEGIAPAELEPV